VVDEFNKKMRHYTGYMELVKEISIDIGSVDTDTSEFSGGSFFDLNDPDTLVIKRLEVDEVVKRIHIKEEDLKLLVEDDFVFEALLGEVHKYMDDKKCTCYTFKFPEGDFVREIEGSSNVELRVYGFKNKGE